MIKNVFFDRDGTLGSLTDVRYPQTFALFPDAKAAIAALKGAGLNLYVASNQACIARGTDGGYDFAAEFTALGMDDWFICPHDKGDGCQCRKPKTGLLDAAVQKYGMRREECVMVGDRETDVACGKAAGMRTVLLGKGESAADATVSSLSEAANVILQWNAQKE